MCLFKKTQKIVKIFDLSTKTETTNVKKLAEDFLIAIVPSHQLLLRYW